MFIERGRLGRVSASFTDATGRISAPESPKVTIVRDLTGETIVEAEDAQVGDDLVTFDVDPIAGVDWLALTWTGQIDGTELTVETRAEVVGGRLCALEEIEAKVGAAASPTDSELAAARDIAEAVLEDRCEVAFRPRYFRETLPGNGKRELLVSRPRLLRVLAVSINGESISLGDVSPTLGGAVEIATRWPQGAQVEIAYEHGWPAPPPDVRDAAMDLARDLVIRNPSDLDHRAGRIETAEAIYGFVTHAGINGAETSIPSVNAVIEARRYRPVG